MRLSRQELTSKEPHFFDEELVIALELIQNNPLIINIDKIKLHLESRYVSSMTLIKIDLDASMILKSTRSLKPVPYQMRVKDDVVVCYDNESFDPDSMITLDGDYLDIDEICYSLIIASLPIKVISPDDDDIIKGESWEVITEEEYNKRKNEDNSSSPFAALKDLDF